MTSKHDVSELQEIISELQEQNFEFLQERDSLYAEIQALNVRVKELENFKKRVTSKAKERQDIAEEQAQSLVDVVTELRGKGLSIRKISRELNSRGIPTPTGKGFSCALT